MLCDLFGISVGQWRPMVNLLPGSRFEHLSKEQVEDILGPPDMSFASGTTYAGPGRQGPALEAESEYYYNVGYLDYGKGYLREPSHLIIGFDEKGVVSLILVNN